MIKKRLVAMAIFLFGLNTAVLAQGLIYDGMTTYNPAVIKPDVRAIFEKEVFPQARTYFKDKAECDESFKIDDGSAIEVATNYSEKIYLYTYCGDPSVNSYQGIAVIKNGKITDHFVFSTFVLHFDSIFYKNGLVALGGTGTKRNSDWGIVTAIDWNNSANPQQTSFFSYQNSCDENGQWVKTRAKKDVTNEEPKEGLKEVLLDWIKIK